MCTHVHTRVHTHLRLCASPQCVSPTVAPPCFSSTPPSPFSSTVSLLPRQLACFFMFFGAVGKIFADASSSIHRVHNVYYIWTIRIFGKFDFVAFQSIYIYMGVQRDDERKLFFLFFSFPSNFLSRVFHFFFFFLKDRWLFESLNLKSINLLIDFLTIADLERFRNDMVRMFESSSLFFYADFFFSHEFEEQVDASLTFFSLPILTAINNCFFVSHITGWIDELYIYRHNPCILNLRVSFLS